jgi:hypothetical protein
VHGRLIPCPVLPIDWPRSGTSWIIGSDPKVEHHTRLSNGANSDLAPSQLSGTLTTSHGESTVPIGKGIHTMSDPLPAGRRAVLTNRDEVSGEVVDERDHEVEAEDASLDFPITAHVPMTLDDALDLTSVPATERSRVVVLTSFDSPAPHRGEGSAWSWALDRSLRFSPPEILALVSVGALVVMSWLYGGAQ